MSHHNKCAYLTIDDGPSARFTDLIDVLEAHKIPAVFFNRGDAMEANPDAVIYGIKHGYIMANHGYSHKRASNLSYEEICEEITRTEDIIDALYVQANVYREEKYFRFPYLDRGMGACFAEPKGLNAEHIAVHNDLLRLGLGNEPIAPTGEMIEKKCRVQNFLKAEGFSPLPTAGVTHPWYAKSEMAEAIDSLCTFSTSDWALGARHKGKHGFDTLDDLKAQIDNDPWLGCAGSADIILAHDQAEVFDTTVALINYFCEKGYKFQNLSTGGNQAKMEQMTGLEPA